MADTCIACGVPMEAPTDHAAGDPEKPYCRHCARPDGTMQSYEEKLASMTRFIMESEGGEESSACGKAAQWLAQQPAWRRCDS